MKRTGIGIALLAMILALGIFTTVWMDRHHSPIGEDLKSASQAAMAEDWARAETLARRAEKDWQRCRKFTAALADHNPMEEIDGLFAELEVFTNAREQVHFAATCARLSRQLEAMGDAHGLIWWNIL